MGLLHLSSWMFLPLTVACLLWGGQELDSVYTIMKKKKEGEREIIKLYFGEGGD